MKKESLHLKIDCGSVGEVQGGMIVKRRNAAGLFIMSILVVAFLIAGCKDEGVQATGMKNNRMSTIDDLKDKRIGVLLGSAYDGYTRKNYPQATVLQYKTTTDVILAIKTGKIDASIYTRESLLEILKSDPTLGILGEVPYSTPIGMGFNKENGELREKFNAFLKQTKADGTYDNMVKRWVTEGREEMPEIKNPKSNGNLVVGVASDEGLPFGTMKNNRIVGFDIEMAERFAAYLGKELVLKDMEFSGLIGAVASSKIDMVDSTLIITEERKKQIDFSDPYYELGTNAVVLKKNIAGGGKAEKAAQSGLVGMQTFSVTPYDRLSVDLNRSKVGVMTGTTNEMLVRENFQSANLQCYDGTMDAVGALKAGHVDVVVTGFPNALNVIKKNRDLKMLPDVLELDDTAIAVKKEDTRLLEELNGILNEFAKDGTLEDMQKRWLKEDISPYKTVELRVPTEGTAIRVGMDATREPFCFRNAKGEITGLDGELARRIAIKLGRPVEFYDMKFAALIPSLKSGKTDVIISMMTATDERRKSVNFTTTYYKQRIVMLVRSGDAGGDTAGFTRFFKGVSQSFYNNLIVENRYILIVDGLNTTVIISLFSVLFGTLLGALVCFMRMSKNRIVSALARIYISLLRGTPVLVVLMLTYYVVFGSVNIDPVLVAVIAFGMNFAAYVSEMFRTAIESVDKGQKEAGIAGGFTTMQTFAYIIIPQAVRQVLPVYKGEFISLVKMTSVVGYIAVQDLTKASDIIRSRTFDAFFPLVMVGVIYLVITWLLGLILDYIGRKTDPKQNRRKVVQ